MSYGLNEDRYFDGLLNQHLAKEGKAEARQDAIDEISLDLQAAALAKCATVESISRDSGQFLYYRSSLQEFIGEIDGQKMAELGKLVRDGDIFGTGNMLIALVTAEIKKESDYEAEDQVDGMEDDARYGE